MSSIRKKGENTYEITVSKGYNSEGQKLREYKTIVLAAGMTERQIQKELTRASTLFEEEIRSGDYINPNLYRLSDFCNEYLKFTKNTLAPRTWQSYKKTIDQRLIPVLGNYKLTEIKPLNIQRLINELQDPGKRKDGKGDFLSSASIKRMHAVIQSVFARAYKLGLITKNPATTDCIDLPKIGVSPAFPIKPTLRSEEQ
jgi:integrase